MVGTPPGICTCYVKRACSYNYLRQTFASSKTLGIIQLIAYILPSVLFFLYRMYVPTFPYETAVWSYAKNLDTLLFPTMRHQRIYNPFSSVHDLARLNRNINKTARAVTLVWYAQRVLLRSCHNSRPLV